jgi:hypothetical protein
VEKEMQGGRKENRVATIGDGTPKTDAVVDKSGKMWTGCIPYTERL